MGEKIRNRNLIGSFVLFLNSLISFGSNSQEVGSGGHGQSPQPGKNESVSVGKRDEFFAPDECPEWIRKLEGVPECPKGPTTAQVLPENFPIGVYMINAGPGAHTPTAQKLAEQILEGAEFGKPPIVIVGTHANLIEFNKLKNELKGKFANKFPGANWDAFIRPTRISNMAYPQDRAQPFFSAEGVGLWVSEDRAPWEYALPPSCGIRVQKSSRHFNNAGDYESIAPGVLATVSGGELIEKLGGNQANIFKLPGITGVGHADEIIKVIPSNRPSPCNFTVLVASQNKAQEVLNQRAKQYPQEKLLGINFSEKPSEIDFSLASRKLIERVGKNKGAGLSSISDLCLLVFETPKIVFESGNPSAIGELKFERYWLVSPKNPEDRLYPDRATPAEIEEYVRKNGEYRETFVLAEGERAKIASDEKLRELPCTELTVEQVARALDFAKWVGGSKDPKIKNLFSVHENFWEKSQKLSQVKSDLEKKLKESVPGCDRPDVLEIPALFAGGVSNLPNAVNGITTSQKSVALPKTYSAAFDEYLKTEITQKRKLGLLQVDTFGINDPFYKNTGQAQGGNLHCATLTIPLCRP